MIANEQAPEASDNIIVLSEWIAGRIQKYELEYGVSTGDMLQHLKNGSIVLIDDVADWVALAEHLYRIITPLAE